MDKALLGWFSILKKRTWGGTLSKEKSKILERSPKAKETNPKTDERF